MSLSNPFVHARFLSFLILQNSSRKHPTDRMQPAPDPVGIYPKNAIRSDGGETDRMDGAAVAHFAFIYEFTPHNHVWLIISA